MENINTIVPRIKRFLNQKFIRTGAPFFTFMLLGAVGLKQFANLRYEFPRSTTVEDIKKAGIDYKASSIEEEYEKIKDKSTEYVNKRIPRPWSEEDEANVAS